LRAQAKGDDDREAADQAARNRPSTHEARRHLRPPFSRPTKHPLDEDQAAICRAYVERQGWRVTEVYADAAMSGESVHGRDAFARRVADAEAQWFEIILAKDIERPLRNLGDVEPFRDRIEFIGIEIRTMADGEVTQMNAALKGLGSAMMLTGHARAHATARPSTYARGSPAAA
jgi:DNA invertase Pin-like site-specific DNA recombinase